MSYSSVLAVVPNRRPQTLVEFRNSHGWSASIWRRLHIHHGYGENWMNPWSSDGVGDGLTWLWQNIETLPDWEQAPLILTFDTGVIPQQAFGWAADGLEEFNKRLPSPEEHVDHVPAMINLLRKGPETPLLAVWGTSVSENPFDPWRYEEDEDGNIVVDEPGSGIPLSEMYILERHRPLVDEMFAHKV